jgi:hypothetical protein
LYHLAIDMLLIFIGSVIDPYVIYYGPINVLLFLVM